jgi:4-hydroxy-tetrahydrodipicolinate reductase
MAHKILVNGSAGRMGQAIIECAPLKGIEVHGEVDQGIDPESFISGCDAIIDFSIHSITPKIVELAVKYRKPVVIGTTGHSEEEREWILAATQKIPIVWAGNYSTGVNLLFYLTQKTAEVLQEGYDPEVIEMHHKHKVDAPSGTAARLLEVLQESFKLSDDEVKHGREGIIGPRPVKEIGMHTLRGGDVVGDHTVIFAGDGERIELTHKASNRNVFANGSLDASKWVTSQKPGLYSMQDVLGLH